jgi:radical SAM family RiPP maturation amino acid epimerase
MTYSPALIYRQIFDNRDEAGLRVLARIKRFLESWSGDAELRDRLEAAFEANEPLDGIRAAYNIEIDPTQLQPVFRKSLAHLRGTPQLADYPLAVIWDRYLAKMAAYRNAMRELGQSEGANPRFDKWRKRQISRCESELGLSATAIVHPVVAFELSDGCSVGCWFCGISADKFKGHWPYEPNQHLWRDILKEVAAFFGKAAATGFCYWATDPSDNPDYPRFIEDFYHAIGVLPQTTTAVPLRNVELTRSILALNDKHRTTINRFSVLTKKTLNRIHETFTADELVGVELVLQSREATVAKSVSGRARERVESKAKELTEDHTTIACVTGFLVKLPAGLIQLVTPCRSTAETPNGYHIMAERRFHDAKSFAAALRELEQCMVVEAGSGDTLALRRDLILEQTEEGFTIRDARFAHSFAASFAPRLGEMLQSGNYTFQQAYDILLREGADVFELAETIDWMFATGLFNEDPKHPGIRGIRAMPVAA